MISIIVPVYHEADILPDWLHKLFEAHAVGECVVIDASEAEALASTRKRLSDKIPISRLHYITARNKGRAAQMNQGAELSEGSILLFLHADTYLPEGALSQIQAAIGSGAHWGRFDVGFDHPGRVYRMIAAMMNWRSRRTGIATGDQAIFISRGAFDLVGAYDDIALMEDIAISRKLKTIGPPVCLESKVQTAARRWEEKGVLKTMALMWWLRFAYWAGISPERLAGWYR